MDIVEMAPERSIHRLLKARIWRGLEDAVRVEPPGITLDVDALFAA